MADVAETTKYPDAATAISQGKRHLLVQDYAAAVTALAEGLEMMSQKHGDCDDELGEPYLLYGRALLGLAREEVGVLGEGVPGSEEAEEDDDEEEDDEIEEGKMSEIDEDEKMDTKESPEKKNRLDDDKKNDSENREEAAAAKKMQKDDKNVAPGSNKTDDSKIEDKKMETNDDEVTPREKKIESVVAGTSKDSQKNGSIGKIEAKNCNGTAEKTSKETAEDEDDEEEEEEEDVNKEEDEEDPGRGIDLQVAWEVLELAKIVFTHRGESGLKYLAETQRLLGEVAMESDNPHGAIADLEGALALLEKLEPCEPRAIADIHYQLGLAHSLANDFDASIKQFGEATSLLEARIKQLEDTKEPTGATAKIDDPFYTIEGEIKELRELLPAIQEKIVDMKDFKEEACRLVIEGIKNKVASGGCTNGAGTSNDDGQSSSSGPTNASCPATISAKPASDISHLVRKKRKNEENDDQAQSSPCKKSTA